MYKGMLLVAMATFSLAASADWNCGGWTIDDANGSSVSGQTFKLGATGQILKRGKRHYTFINGKSENESKVTMTGILVQEGDGTLVTASYTQGKDLSLYDMSNGAFIYCFDVTQ